MKHEEINKAKIHKEKELTPEELENMDMTESEKKLLRFFIEKNKTRDVIKIFPIEECITLHGEDDVNSFIEMIQKVQKGSDNEQLCREVGVSTFYREDTFSMLCLLRILTLFDKR